MPFLCLYLAWKKLRLESKIQNPKSPAFQFSNSIGYFLLTVLALLYAPAHLIAVATPEWRLVSWALAIEVVGITLLLIYFVLGPEWMKRLAFPVFIFWWRFRGPTFSRAH